MKVTKQGVTFTDSEMRDFVFPMLRQGLSKQLDSYYSKECPPPKKVKAELKEYLEKFNAFASELKATAGVETLSKNNQKRWCVAFFAIGDNPRFVAGGGVGLTERVLCEAPRHVQLVPKKKKK